MQCFFHCYDLFASEGYSHVYAVCLFLMTVSTQVIRLNTPVLKNNVQKEIKRVKFFWERLVHSEVYIHYSHHAAELLGGSQSAELLPKIWD